MVKRRFLLWIMLSSGILAPRVRAQDMKSAIGVGMDFGGVVPVTDVTTHAAVRHQEAGNEQGGGRDAHRRRRHGTEQPEQQEDRALRSSGEGPPEEPDNVAVLAPQVKGDAGSHEQHSDVGHEQGLDIESHCSFTYGATLADYQKNTRSPSALQRADDRGRRLALLPRVGAG